MPANAGEHHPGCQPLLKNIIIGDNKRKGLSSRLEQSEVPALTGGERFIIDFAAQSLRGLGFISLRSK